MYVGHVHQLYGLLYFEYMHTHTHTPTHTAHTRADNKKSMSQILQPEAKDFQFLLISNEYMYKFVAWGEAETKSCQCHC